MKSSHVLSTGAVIIALTSSTNAANILLNSEMAPSGLRTADNWTVSGETANTEFVTSKDLFVGFGNGDGLSWYTANSSVGITVTQTVTTTNVGDFILSADFMARNDDAVPASHGSPQFTLNLLSGATILTADSQTGSLPDTPSYPGNPATNQAKTYSGLAAGTYTVQYTIKSGQGAVDNVELDFTQVPEPSGTALIGLASLGYILRRRR